MYYKAATEGIVAYLTRIKKLLSKGKYDFIPRKKNLRALAKYGFTIASTKKELLDLAASNYYKGSKQDFDPNRPGEIWEFKKKIKGVRFYIKIKIVNENGNEVLECLVFHEDDFA